MSLDMFFMLSIGKGLLGQRCFVVVAVPQVAIDGIGDI